MTSVSPLSASRLSCGSIGELRRERLSGLGTSRVAGSPHIVSDQNALTGGNWPGAKQKRPLTFIPGNPALFYAHSIKHLFSRNHLKITSPFLG